MPKVHLLLGVLEEPRPGMRTPHALQPDCGVEARWAFHKLHSTAIEKFNGQFKGIFECGG